MEPNAHTTARDLRRRLGIPDDARQVIIFAESSHWDPSWLFTSEEYFSRWVSPNLDAATDALLAAPRRVYGVECMFFLRMYWERRPERRALVRELVNAGRLRLSSSGVTTPDTIIPSAEALLRDFLLGQEWLRANGMAAEPRLAYFTDSFGATPALPTILRAAGFDRTAISRIDGQLFLGADYEPAARFPRPGSSAELLLVRERSADFIWRDASGAEVLCHWNPFTYGQGDMLASRGVVRIYLAPLPLAAPARSEAHIARRIAEYAAQLAPLSRTRYMLCPIGLDFNAPIPDLVSLLDRYNRSAYPSSGIWAVNAGLDDYLTLVEEQRERLPVMQLDPNPYWSGFYTARPSLKQQHRALVDTLLLAERLSLLPERAAAAQEVARELAEAWWDAAACNHHDCITGTSPDRVVEAEQRPWIERAQAAASAVVTRLAAAQPVPPATPSRAELPEWRRVGGRLELRTPHYHMELSEDIGGGIVACHDATSGRALLAGLSNDLVSYEDTGGLWRMGHEYRGGRLTQSACASEGPARLIVSERRGGLEVSCTSQLDGEPITRRLWLSAGAPDILLRVEGRAAARRTLTVCFATGIDARQIAMDVPGGVVERPWRTVYDPTFWALQSFAHIAGRDGGRGMALMLGQPGAVALRAGGRLELVALRNATRELAYGFLPLLATPATGHERFVTATCYALRFTAAGGWRANEVVRAARELAWTPWETDEAAALRALADGVVQINRADVALAAVKPASRGAGIIVRLMAAETPGGRVELALPGRAVAGAWRCDARERDLGPLEVRDGRVDLALDGVITSVRLMVGG